MLPAPKAWAGLARSRRIAIVSTAVDVLKLGMVAVLLFCFLGKIIGDLWRECDEASGEAAFR